MSSSRRVGKLKVGKLLMRLQLCIITLISAQTANQKAEKYAKMHSLQLVSKVRYCRIRLSYLCIAKSDNLQIAGIIELNCISRSDMVD